MCCYTSLIRASLSLEDITNMRRHIIVLLISHFVMGTVCAEAELNLIRDLMNHYDPDVRPSHLVQEPIKVALDLTLHQIIEVNARDQVLTCSVWQRLYWTDEHLKWDPDQYGGIKRIRLSAGRIWKPDIALVNDVRGESHESLLAYPAAVSHEGAVRWLTPRLLQSSCTLDMTYFPWDTQSCLLEFSSWTYDSSELILTNISISADTTTDYIQNGEWDLIDVPVSLYKQKAPCCEDPFIIMDFYVHIRRKAKYYIGNLIFPSALITASGMLVFCLPAASGEKVSLSVTILLATTVYQLLLAERMPVQSVTTPVIGTYIMFTQILLGLSTALTVLVINLHHQGSMGRRVPPLVRSLIRVLACPLGLRHTANQIWTPKQNEKKSRTSLKSNSIATENFHLVNHTSENPTKLHTNNSDEAKKNNSESGLAPYVQKMADTLNNFEMMLNEKESGENVQTEWMFVSKVLDRLFLVLFGVCIFVCSLAILTGHSHYRLE